MVLFTEFSMVTATILTLLAATLWGSWMQVVKHLGKYPIMGLGFWLYAFSFVLVWGVTLVLAPFLLPQGIVATSTAHSGAIIEILIGGAMMSVGLLISIAVMHEIGLLLSTAISGAIGSILGLLTTISKEGIPRFPLALPLIVGSTVIFLVAGYLCSYASQLRDTDVQKAQGQQIKKAPTRVTPRIIMLLLINTVLINGWSMGTASGTANNIPPILTCAYMATGSFLSILLYCGFYFTTKKMWKTVLCLGQSKKPLVLSAVSAVCHYGGNMISIYSMPALTATLSFLYGRTATVWTYFWGIYYQEFSGSSKKTTAVLVSGLALYFVGILMLGVLTLTH